MDFYYGESVGLKDIEIEIQRNEIIAFIGPSGCGKSMLLRCFSRMNEPSSALDPIAAARVEKLILELKHNYTIVMVTHNMLQAARVADRTAFFYLGELG